MAVTQLLQSSVLHFGGLRKAQSVLTAALKLAPSNSVKSQNLSLGVISNVINGKPVSEDVRNRISVAIANLPLEDKTAITRGENLINTWAKPETQFKFALSSSRLSKRDSRYKWGLGENFDTIARNRGMLPKVITVRHMFNLLYSHGMRRGKSR